MSSSSIPSGTIAQPPAPRVINPWILSPWLDLQLFLLTPLCIVPLVFGLVRSSSAVDAELIGLIVSAFGGMGHHLPGMLRAYFDHELFRRFRLRFIFAPLILLAVCIAFSRYRLNSMLLVLSVWGCWHALMQVYGFARIYDAKVGAISTWNARWDWLMCLSWFGCGQIYSDGKLARLLEYWYDSGGPLISPEFVHSFQRFCLAICVLVTIGFLGNHFRQTRGPGPQPNPIKLLMLASGIGFWWFAMVFVDQIVLGIALFEAFHDVQYLAIVWLYNCRRTRTASDMGSFMKFLFRNGHGMLWLYVGLVFGYGMIGLAARPLENQALKEALNGFVWASTLLHFYYDGFIWKVREPTSRVALGLGDASAPIRAVPLRWGEFGHLLKWTPLIVLLSWTTVVEISGSKFPVQEEERRIWPFALQVERAQNIASAVPDDLRAQRRAAITLTNLGRHADAIQFLQHVLKRRPDFGDGHQLLGEIYILRGELTLADSSFRRALKDIQGAKEQAMLHHHLGSIQYELGHRNNAEHEFREALRIVPKFEPSQNALRIMSQDSPPPKAAP